jgi:hypothetical protein
VALRPRLSPGVPLSRGGSPEIRSGTGVVKCGLESHLVRERLGLLGNLRWGSVLLGRSGPACRLGRAELHVTAHAPMPPLVALGKLAEVPMRECRLVSC